MMNFVFSSATELPFAAKIPAEWEAVEVAPGVHIGYIKAGPMQRPMLDALHPALATLPSSGMPINATQAALLKGVVPSAVAGMQTSAVFTALAKVSTNPIAIHPVA